MRVLLDTHVLLWLAAEPERVGRAHDVLTDPAVDLVLSAASVWELAIKVGSGRLVLPAAVEDWVRSCSAALRLTHLSVDWQDAAAVAGLPPLHRDPFDRLLVVQAVRAGLPLATADRLVQQYDVEVIAVG